MGEGKRDQQKNKKVETNRYTDRHTNRQTKKHRKQKTKERKTMDYIPDRKKMDNTQ